MVLDARLLAALAEARFRLARHQSVTHHEALAGRQTRRADPIAQARARLADQKIMNKLLILAVLVILLVRGAAFLILNPRLVR